MNNIQSIRTIINGLRLSGNELTTVKIIQLLTGNYTINHGMSPANSPNAQFGKFLKRNSHLLGITFSYEKSINIAGNTTTTAVWL
jgi:hypothetical protein